MAESANIAVTEPVGRAHREFRERRAAVFARRGFVAREGHLPRRDGRRIHVLNAGQGDVPTVLVHGGVGDTAEWAPVAPLLHGRVVVVDMPGFGLSEPPAAGYADWGATCAAWLLDVVDGLGVERIQLVGGSMGGYAAINFAAAHPDRIQHLVLAGSAGGLFTDIGMFLRLWTVPGLGKLVSNLPLRDIEAVRTRMMAPYVGEPSAIPDDLLSVALSGVNLPDARKNRRDMIRSVATLSGWKPELRVDEHLVQADVPTTFVWGDLDSHATPDVAHGLAARMRDASVVVVERAGHLPHIEYPEALAHVLNDKGPDRVSADQAL